MARNTPGPRAYETGSYLWRFQDIPETVESNGQQIPNPVRRSAVFVVHGMGNQAYLDTAVTLRDGFEDVIDELHKSHGLEKVPTPFTFEGYWGNYDNLEQTFPQEWASFNERERVLFSKLWRRRVFSKIRTFYWFVTQGLRLIGLKMLLEVGPIRWLTYWGVVVLGLIGFIYVLVRHPKILATVLGDVRLYLDSSGDIEAAIVQRIDRRVGEQFLLLLGLDWNFETLPPEKQLQIGGKPHVFSYVTWLAHSLGSVISYNVISDLLTRCQQLRATLAKPVWKLTPQERQLQCNIEQVERGLHRFITIGSPLEKVAFLFPGVLRPWPKPYVGQFAQASSRHWWINFFHVWDPVSGRLRNQEYFHVVQNLHSHLWRVPGWAHASYWRDRKILTYLITRAYGPEVLRLPRIEFMDERRAELWRRLNFFALWIILIGAILGLVRYRGYVWPLIWKAMVRVLG